jgi:hypothetical protein
VGHTRRHLADRRQPRRLLERFLMLPLLGDVVENQKGFLLVSLSSAFVSLSRENVRD